MIKSGDISNAKEKKDLPTELIQYIDFIEKETNVKIKYISVGPNRNQIIEL